MMKLEEIRKAYEDLSGSLSSVVRQINFAGIAIVWIFVGKETETVSVPQHLYNACTFLVISIILDVLQYLVGTFSWHMCYLFKHKKKFVRMVIFTLIIILVIVFAITTKVFSYQEKSYRKISIP